MNSGKRIRFRLEYLAFLLLSPWVQLMSAKTIYHIGRFVGKFGHQFLSKRRRIAKTNLDIAFGDSKSNWEKEKIIERSFTMLVTSGLQCLWCLPNPEKRVHELIPSPPEGLDDLKSCLEKNKGVFFLTAHYGNWEIMGVYHGFMKNAQLNSIARKLDNPYLEKVALNLRTVSGNGIFYRDESPRNVIRVLKENQCVAIMMDQNTVHGGIFVDFFGKPAATTRSIATLSYLTGAPIVPLFSYPCADGTYKIKYGPELKLEKTGDKKQDIHNWTVACEKYIESEIQRYPEPWMWGHRRWKTRPESENGRGVYSA